MFRHVASSSEMLKRGNKPCECILRTAEFVKMELSVRSKTASNFIVICSWSAKRALSYINLHEYEVISSST